jgi:hypothetical protein
MREPAGAIDTPAMRNSSTLINAKRATRALNRCLFVMAAVLSLPTLCGIGMGQQTGANSKDENPRGLTGKTSLTVPTQPVPMMVVEKQVAVATVVPDPIGILRTAKIIHVTSTSLLVRATVVEEKLQKRSEFQQLGLVITRDEHAADLILELRHDLFTMYVFTVIDPKTQLVVASGKLSSLGGTVAGKVAERFMKRLVQARLAAKL